MGGGAERALDRRARKGARVRPDPRPHPRDLQLQGPDPLGVDPGQLPLQLLAGRRAPARHLAPHHPRGVPQGRAGMGDPARRRRPRRSRRRAVGLQGRRLSASGLRAVHGRAVAGRRRRRGAARVRRRDQDLGRGRLLRAAGQGWRGLAGRELAVGPDRLRTRHDDELGLPATLQAVDARHAARRGDPSLGGPGGLGRTERLQPPQPGGPLRPDRHRPRVLPRPLLPDPGRPQGQARPAGGRFPAGDLQGPPADLAAHRLDGRRRHLPAGRAARHRPRRLPGRQPRLRECSSSPPSGCP